MSDYGRSVEFGVFVEPLAEPPILHKTALVHVATPGSNGEPQSTPVWFD